MVAVTAKYSNIIKVWVITLTQFAHIYYAYKKLH